MAVVPKWVKSGRDARQLRRPLLPRKWTFADTLRCPLCATNGLMRCSKQRFYSMTLAARATGLATQCKQKDRPVAAFRISEFRQPFRLQEFGTILSPDAWSMCRKLPE
jgi:hypothetical protein